MATTAPPPTPPQMPKESAITMASKSFEQLEIATGGEDDNSYKPSHSSNGEEGVEVVLGERGADQVVDAGPARPTPDQNVFRGAHPPRGSASASSRGGSYPNGPPPPPYGAHPTSGSFGYGRQYDRPPRPSYAVPTPTYNPSGSFDDGSYHNRAATAPSHYSPHPQYPPAGARYPGEDFNVISPNHKSSDPKYRSTGGGRSSASSSANPPPPSSFQYPPASPVSRAGGQTASPPRLKNLAVHRTINGPYSKAQRGKDPHHPQDGTWNPYPAPSRTASGDRPQPPLVAESSFDSDHFSHAAAAANSHAHYSPRPPHSRAAAAAVAAGHPVHPATPGPGSGAPHHDPAQQFYGPAGSWGSFDSAAPHRSPYDDGYGRPPHRTPSLHYPESPYSPYSHQSPGAGYHSQHSQHYSPGGYYGAAPDQYGSYHSYGPPPQSYDEGANERMIKDYHPDRDGQDHTMMMMDGTKKKSGNNKAATGCVLPDAAHEIDFDVTDPPAEPICPPSTVALVESLGDVNGYDVLCGRGGGTNSQVGNKRFRQLVQDFQPTYLLARRKEKPLLARTIVLIIRKRAGRFLRKDEESGMLYEVGDLKAEAKTSQALREGLDVRATKSATNGKKKKKKASTSGTDESPLSPESVATTKAEEETLVSPAHTPERPTSGNDGDEKMASPVKKAPLSPPSLPKLADEEVKAGMVHPHSPEALQFRKRRRMRTLACGADKFFPDFCPPRADLGRGASPTNDDDDDDIIDSSNGNTNTFNPHSPMRRKSSIDDGDTATPTTRAESPGCTGAVMEIVAGAVTGGFCFGT